jgi:hypothetical protein
MTIKRPYLLLEVSEASGTPAMNGESGDFNASDWTDNGHMGNAIKPVLSKAFGHFGRIEMGGRRDEPR